MRVGSRKWLKDKLRKSNKHKQFKINKCKYSSSSVSHLLRSGVSFFFVARHNVRQAPKIYIQACSGRRGHQNTTHNCEKKTCGPCHLCGITSDSSRYFHFAEKDNPFYQWVREMKNVTIHDCINFVKNTKWDWTRNIQTKQITVRFIKHKDSFNCKIRQILTMNFTRTLHHCTENARIKISFPPQ